MQSALYEIQFLQCYEVIQTPIPSHRFRLCACKTLNQKWEQESERKEAEGEVNERTLYVYAVCWYWIEPKSHGWIKCQTVVSLSRLYRLG